jgi:DnaJ-domain-containing protein 1
MRWKGAIIGALLGLLLFRGRWPGALIGGLLGALVDAGAFRTATETSAAPPPQALPDDPYRTLELAPTATDDEVEAAYRRLIAQYHPDRVAGAAGEIRDLAETRARAINAAYEKIQKIRRGR